MISFDDYKMWFRNTLTNAEMAAIYLCDNPTRDESCYYGPRPNMPFKKIIERVREWNIQAPSEYYQRAVKDGWELPAAIVVAIAVTQLEAEMRRMKIFAWVMVGLSAVNAALTFWR